MSFTLVPSKTDYTGPYIICDRCKKFPDKVDFDVVYDVIRNPENPSDTRRSKFGTMRMNIHCHGEVVYREFKGFLNNDDPD